MDNDPGRSTRLQFSLKTYMETSVSRNYVEYLFEVQLRCNELIKYEIKSSLRELTKLQRTIVVYLEENAKDEYGLPIK